MKHFIKKCGIFTVCFCVILCCVLNSFAYIDCDGNINAYEWKDVEQNILFERSGHSGCCYHSACVKFKYIEQDRRIYLAVFLDNSINNDFDGTDSEIIISFNDSSEVILRTDLTSDYNEDAFLVNFGYFADGAGGGTYETEIVLKELEYDNILTLNLTLKDYHGDTSQTYQLNIKSEEFKEEESESLAQAEKESEEAAEEASKNKTTKKTSAKTTKKKTTTEKETTTEFKTAVITESYESYSRTLEKNNNSILIIGGACVVTSLCAMCIVLFKKK
ncbi:MAG: hypothetical protein E7536_10995 [Ruminococcaceae bacterium]|nr:hypothetical protein [Oscillospiraceae bacterium]